MASPDEILKKTADLLNSRRAQQSEEKGRLERERRELVTSLGKEIADVVGPAINKLAQSQQVTLESVKSMLREVRVEAPRIPEIRIPEVRVPQPKVTVSVPEVRVPTVNIPETKINFPSQMSVSMDSVDRDKPLPVMMMDTKGKPMSFSMGASGGRGDHFTIKGFGQSAYSELTNADGRLKVSVETGGSAITDAELRASSVPVEQVSGSLWSTSVVDAFGSTAVDGVWNADNRLRVSLETGGSGLTDAELRATSVPVSQVSGANWSTEVTNTVTVDGSGVTQPVSATDLDTRDLVNATDSVSVYQVSGANWSTEVTNTVTVDGSGVTQPVSATNLDIRDLVNASDSVSAYQVSGANWSTEVTNTVTTAPINVRGSRATAYATISSDAETSLISGVASTYLDLIYVMGANQSDGAVTLDLACGTGGATVLSLEIPANSTAGVAPATAVPMPEVAQPWVMTFADADTTGTTVDMTGLFSKET